MKERYNGNLSRRDFIKVVTGLVGGTIGTVLGMPIIEYTVSPALEEKEKSSWVNAGPIRNYEIGVPKLFQFTQTIVNGWERTGVGYGAFIVRIGEEEARAFSFICTHLGCHVSWHPNIKNYVSPCHDGHFDIMGKNISGPPPRPLDEFATKIEEGDLMIKFPPFKRTS